MVAGNVENIKVRLNAEIGFFKRSMDVANASLRKFKTNMVAFNQVMSKPQKEFNAMNAGIAGMANNSKKASKGMVNLKQDVTGFGASAGNMWAVLNGKMSNSQKGVGNMNDEMNVMNTTGGKVARGIRNLTQGVKGFRMELLGTMFFGMALTRIYKGLTRTSMEWMGVTDVMSAALGLLFLPVAEKVLDWALLFLDWVGNLSEKQKKWIGILVVAVGGLGLFLTVLGALGLAIGSLISVFGSFFGILGLIIAAFLGFVGIKVAADYLKDFSDKTGKAEEALSAFGFSGESIEKIKTKVEELYKSFKETFDEKFPEIRKKFIDNLKELANDISNEEQTWNDAGKKIGENVFAGIKDFIYSNPYLVVGAMVGAWFGGPIGALIGSAIGTLFQNLDIEQMNEILDKGMELLDTLLDGMDKNKDKIVEFMRSFAERLGQWIKENGELLGEIGIILGLAIIEGLGYILKGFLEGLPKMIKGALKGSFGSISFGNPKSGSILGMLGFADGGIVPGPIGAPVPAIVHGGEQVIPVGGKGSGMGQTINVSVNANVSSSYDVRRLADELKRYWVSDFERVSQGRSI